MNQFLVSMVAAAAMALAGVTSGFADSIQTALNLRSIEDVKQLRNEPVPEATACPSPGQISVPAERDATIARAFATTNYGRSTTLNTESAVLRPLAAGDQRLLVSFDLTSVNPLCTVMDAELRLYATSSAPERTVSAYRVSGGWDEQSVTWATQPAPSGRPATTSAEPGWQSWNVTGQVKPAAGRGSAGLMLCDSEEGSTIHQAQVYASRDSAETEVPALVLTLG